jgi:hypothetical protein
MLSPEVKLLILGSRIKLNPSQKSEFKQILNKDLDWHELLKRAQKENVSPLLYRNLKVYEDKVPDEIVSQLNRIYITNFGRNLYLLNALKPVLDSIENSGMRVALVKGPRLAKTLYKDIGLRFFIDVDLFLDSSQRTEFQELLRGLGFVQAAGEHISRELSEREKIFWTYRPVYRKGKLELELHYNFPGLHMPFSMREDLWRSIQKIDIEGSPAQILSPEYELCLLCLHSQQHSYSRLDWFTDIAEMISIYKLNWNKVLDICRREKIEASVYYGLHLVNEFWPNTVSENIISRFSISSLNLRLLHFFWPQDLVKSRQQKLLFPMHAPTFFSVLNRRRIGPFIQALYNFFFPPRSWVSFYYGISPHSYKMGLHYLWRFWRPLYLIFRRLIETG